VRLGIYGGSFDPPHLGHLLPVLDAAEQLGLDGVRFVPAAIQPLKAGRATASPADRLAMTERLVQGIPGFTVDPAEIDRPGLSYTVDTLAAVAAEIPGAELFLLLGADAYALFDQWRDPERVRALATIVVMAGRRNHAAA
jgi:nicotinate-nucleotide adenylyltransferase